MFADALISIDVGTLNVTATHIGAFSVPFFGALTAIVRFVVRYLQERAAEIEKVHTEKFQLALAFAQAQTQATAAIENMTERLPRG